MRREPDGRVDDPGPAGCGLDNITFLDRDNVISGEDAGDALHTSRELLDSAFIFPIDEQKGSTAIPTPLRFLGEGRDASATIDASGSPTIGSANGNDGDNEITGLHISDGDSAVKGLIGTHEPQFLRRNGVAAGHGDWRFFWTAQHGDNVTFEVISSPR